MATRVTKVQLRADVAGYKTAMEQAASATAQVGAQGEKAAQRMQAWQDLGKYAVAAGAAVTAVGVAALKTGIDYNTMQQQSRAALMTMLGSAEAVNAQMAEMDAFARQSPFAKTTFIQAQQQMLAFGIETKKVIPYLDAVQNAVAAAGGSNQQIAELAFIMAQISAAGKITAQDLMQFGQRGVNAAELIGSQMGKTGAQIRNDITAGALDANTALDALAAGMSQKFDGAAANVKNTFVGSVDRVKAAWRDLAADLASPLVDPEGGGLLIDFFNGLADAMRKFQTLPEGLKNTVLWGGLATGAILLLGGTALLAVPKVIAFKVALDTVGVSGPAMLSKLKSVATFLTGPWGAALIGAAIVVKGLEVANNAGKASAEELKNSLVGVATGVKSMQDAIDTAAAGGGIMDFINGSDGSFTLEQLPSIIRDLSDARRNFSLDKSWMENDMAALVQYEKTLSGLAGQMASMPADQVAAIFREMSTVMSDAELIALLNLDAFSSLKGSLLESASAAGVHVDDAELLAMALSGVVPVTDEAAAAAEDHAAELEATSEAAETATEMLNSLIDSISELGGLTRDQGKAHDELTAAIQKATEAAAAEGVAIDGTNEASRGFRDTLRDLEESALESAEAILQNGGSIEEARAEWQAGRDALVSLLEPFAGSRAAAEEMANGIVGSSEEVVARLSAVERQASQTAETHKLLEALRTQEQGSDVVVRSLTDVFNAQMKVDGLDPTFGIYANDHASSTIQAVQMQQIGDKWFTIRAVMDQSTNYGGNGTGGRFSGGFEKYQAFASGGFPSGIYKGGQNIHKFAETGLPWEAYISPHPAYREKNIGIHQEVGRRLGVTSGNDALMSSLIAEVRALHDVLSNPTFVIEGTPITAVVQRVVRSAVPTASAVRADLGR